jgi:hypothetical protein
MAIHAAVVEILIEKSHFEPEVALGIAEAIEVSIVRADLVTVPILDARLASLEARVNASIQEVRYELKSLEARFEARLEQTKAELVRWVFLVMLGNVALSAAATALLNAFK